MDFQALLNELRSIDPAIAESDVKRYLVESGKSASDVTSADLLSIASAIKDAGSKLATAPKGGKVAKSKRQERTKAPQSSVLTKPSKEMDAYENAVVAGIDQYVDVRSDKIASAIQEAPNKLVAKVQTILEEGDCDPEHFRHSGNELVAALFGTMGDSASA